MLVYILKQNGQPFMPTERFGKVRRLLKEKKAKVVRREPFTIKLLCVKSAMTEFMLAL